MTQMPELENPEAKQTDQISSILAGYLTPKNLAQALGVSERTVARWHRFREGPPRVEIGRKVFYRLESVNAWIASCERPEARANRVRRRPRLRTAEALRVPIAMQMVAHFHDAGLEVILDVVYNHTARFRLCLTGLAFYWQTRPCAAFASATSQYHGS